MPRYIRGMNAAPKWLAPGAVVIFTLALLSCFVSASSLADKIVDPSKVAPEFREAAEKRHAEQVKLIGCNKAAREAQIKPREMAKYVADCFDK